MGNEGEMLPWAEDEKDTFNAGAEISSNALVVSLSTGLIAFCGLIIPMMGLSAGYLTSLLVILLIGFCSYYTASLILVHLGRSRNIKESILAHFDGNYNYMIGYGFVNWLSFLPLLIITFNFICLEVQGLLGYPSPWVGPVTAVFFVFLIILLRVKHFAQELMALGVIGIGIFIIFLIWAWATTPSGPKTVPATGNPITMAGSLLTMLQIHNFLAENIIKHHNKNEYQSILKKVFIIGVIFYIGSSMGCFAIVNRKQYIQPAQVLTDYFQKNGFEVIILSVINILVVLSLIPNFLLISMIRFFQVCRVDLHAKITLKELTYIVTVIAVCLGIFVSKVNLQTLFSLNGAVLGYFYIIVFPIWVHFKCIFANRSGGFVYDDPEWNQRIVQNICECDCFYKKKWKLYLETAFLIFLILFGLGLLLSTIVGVLQPQAVPYHHH